MLIVLLPVTIAIVVWAHALVRRGRPAWLRWIGTGCVATTATACAVTLYELHRASATSGMDEAANKASDMANSIAVALNVVAAAGMCAIAAIVVLGYFSLRKPK